MKKQQLISIIGMSLLLALVEPPIAQASNNEENPGFFDSIVNSLNQKLTELTGELGLPDLQQIIDSIMSDKQSENKGTELSTRVENKPNGSYAIQSDLAKQATIKATNLEANNSTLGQSAQSATSEQIQLVSERVNNNIELSEQSRDLSDQAQTLATESQSLDVSQQILQNLSAQSALSTKQNANVASQMALIAENQETLIQLHQQAQVSRALSNMIDAQQADSINEANRIQRREDASNSITSSIQTGMLIMPGGMTLNN